MDGGFSDNLPTFDEDTITVCPFCGESDICPRDISHQLFHVRARFRAYFFAKEAQKNNKDICTIKLTSMRLLN